MSRPGQKIAGGMAGEDVDGENGRTAAGLQVDLYCASGWQL